MDYANHSKWKTRVVVVAGKRFYQVYRLIDEKRGDVEANRETRGGYYGHIFDAEQLAANLNVKEVLK